MGDHIHISDLDGTLLQPDANLSPRAREVLAQLYEREILFTVCTARSLISVQRIMEDVDLHLPVLCENGGHIAWKDSSETVYLETLASPLAEGVYDHGQKRGVTPMVAHTSDGGFGLACPTPSNDGQQWFADQRIAFRDPRFHITANVRSSLKSEIMCMIFIDRSEVMAGLERDLRDKLDGALMMDLFENRYSPGWWWLTVQCSSVSKGNGLVRLAERWGFDPAQTVVFGDAQNDLPLFEAGGHAVAVGNALPEVREAADEIIGPNTDDAVIEWIAAKENLA